MDEFDKLDRALGRAKNRIKDDIKKPKGRSPLTDFGKSAVEGVKKIDIDTSAIERIASKAFPETSNAFGKALDIYSDAKAVKDGAQKQMQPTLNSLKSASRRMLPRIKDQLPAGLYRKLEAMTAPEEGRDKGPDQDQLRSDAIQSAIKETFSGQVQLAQYQQREAKVQAQIDRSITGRRHMEMASRLDRQSKILESVLKFHTTHHANYMMRSLTLQYQHLFVAKDTYNILEAFTKSAEQKLEAIKFNSGLPDIQKQTLSESYKEHMRSVVAGKMNEKLGDWSRNWGSKAFKNLQDKYIKPALDQAEMFGGLAADAINFKADQGDMEDMEDEMGDLFGEGKKKKKKKQGLIGAAGGMFGSMMGKMALTKGGQMLLKTLSGQYGKDLESVVGHAASSAGRRVSGRIDEMDEGGLKNFFKDLVDMPAEKTRNQVQNVLFKNGNQAVPFDLLTRRSIIEIIPGYLARILQQVTTTATGQPAEMVTYDVRSEKFDTQSNVRGRLKNAMFGKQSSRTSNFQTAVDQVYAGYMRNGGNEDEFLGMLPSLIMFFQNSMSSGSDFSIDKIRKFSQKGTNSDYTRKTFKDVKDSDKVAGLLTKALYNKAGEIDPQAMTTIANSLESGMNYVDDHMDLVTQLNAMGQKDLFSDMLDESGKYMDIGKLRASQTDVNYKDLLENAKSSRGWNDQRHQEESAGRQISKNKIFDKAQGNGPVARGLRLLQAITQQTEKGLMYLYTTDSEQILEDLGPLKKRLLEERPKNFQEAVAKIEQIVDAVVEASEEVDPNTGLPTDMTRSTSLSRSLNQPLAEYKKRIGTMKIGGKTVNRRINDLKKTKIGGKTYKQHMRALGSTKIGGKSIRSHINQLKKTGKLKADEVSGAINEYREKGTIKGKTPEELISEGKAEFEKQKAAALFIAQHRKGYARLYKGKALKLFNQKVDELKKEHPDLDPTKLLEQAKDFVETQKASLTETTQKHFPSLATSGPSGAPDDSAPAASLLRNDQAGMGGGSMDLKRLADRFDEWSKNKELVDANIIELLTKGAVTMGPISQREYGYLGARGKKLAKALKATAGFTFGKGARAIKMMYYDLPAKAIGMAGGVGRAAFTSGFMGAAANAVGATATAAGRVAGAAIKGTAHIYAGGLSGAGRILGGLLGGGSKKDPEDEKKPPFCDIYLKDQVDAGSPLLTAARLRKGGLFFKDGTPVEDVWNISQPILDRRGRVLVSAEDLQTGLVDVYNKPLSKRKPGSGSGFNGMGGLGGAAGLAWKGTKGLGRAAKGLLGMANPLIGLYASMFNMGGKAAMGVGKMIGGLLSPSLKKQDLEELVGNKLDKIYQLLEERLGRKKKVAGDIDGDGDRDNGIADKAEKLSWLKDKSQKAREAFRNQKDKAAAALAAKKAASGKGDDDEGGGILDTVTDFMGKGKGKGFFGKAKSLGKGAFNLAKSGGGRLLGAGVSMLGMGGGTVAGAGAGAASAFTGMASSIASAAATGIGTAGSAVVGALPALVSNPAGWAVLGALAIGAAGYGIYSLMKESKATKTLRAERMKIYGASSAQDDLIADLEKRVNDVLQDQDEKFEDADFQEWAKKFGFDPKDKSQVTWFSTWLSRRMVPVFALYSKILSGVYKIKPGQESELKDDDIGKVVQLLNAQTKKHVSEWTDFTPDPQAWKADQGSKFKNRDKSQDAVAPKPEDNTKSQLQKAQSEKKTIVHRFSKDGTALPVEQQAGSSGGGTSRPSAGGSASKTNSSLNRNTVALTTTSELGSLSAQYESGNKGSAAVGYDSTGGTSYGKFQIAAKTGTFAKFLAWLQQKGGNGAVIAQRLAAAGNPDAGGRNGKVPEEWRKIVAEGLMGDYEYQFIKETHFDIAFRGLSPEMAERVSKNKALMDVLWSTAVQHGPTGAVSVFSQTFDPEKSDQQWAKDIYQNRGKRFNSSSLQVQSSVRNRFNTEYQQVANLMQKNSDGQPDSAPASNVAKATGPTPPSSSEAKVASASSTGSSGNPNATTNPDGSTTIKVDNSNVEKLLTKTVDHLDKIASGTSQQTDVLKENLGSLNSNLTDNLNKPNAPTVVQVASAAPSTSRRGGIDVAKSTRQSLYQM